MTAEQPLVHVIILTWNQKELTDACLASMRAVTYGNYRIVVVDNGSVDDSVDFLRAKYPEAIYLETGSNLGFSGGNNVGIKYALEDGAEWVYLLNNDTEVDPRFLDEVMTIAQTDSKIGIVGSTCFYFEPADIIWFAGAHADWLTGDMIDPRVGKTMPATLPVMEDVDETAGAGMLVRRAVIDQVGLLDPAFFIYFEETDWCQRTKRAGWRVVWAPLSKVWHKVSMTFGELSPEMTYLMTRNRWLFMRKNAPNFPLFAMHYFARFTKRALAFQRSGQAPLRRATFIAMFDAVRNNYGRGSFDRIRRLRQNG